MSSGNRSQAGPATSAALDAQEAKDIRAILQASTAPRLDRPSSTPRSALGNPSNELACGWVGPTKCREDERPVDDAVLLQLSSDRLPLLDFSLPHGLSSVIASPQSSRRCDPHVQSRHAARGCKSENVSRTVSGTCRDQIFWLKLSRRVSITSESMDNVACSNMSAGGLSPSAT